MQEKPELEEQFSGFTYYANTVSFAVRQIKSHDVWQLNGRRAMA